MAVFLGMPVMALGRVHVHEECLACGHRSLSALEAWENAREETFVPALEAYSHEPTRSDLAGEALRQTLTYGELNEFTTAQWCM